MMQILVLIDELHARETLDMLGRLVDLSRSTVVLAYARPHGRRVGLDLIRRRPGGRPMAPHRERELAEAEETAGSEAVARAVEIARAHAAFVESTQLDGDPGRAVCEVALRRRVDLVVVRAAGPDRPPLGPSSLGPTARFIADHSPTAVLLLRG